MLDRRQIREWIHSLTALILGVVLLAAGASPAMIVAEEEVVAFAAHAGALLINVGTLYPARLSAMCLAVEAAVQADVRVFLFLRPCGGFGGGLSGLGLEACDLSGVGHGAIVNAEPARALPQACQRPDASEEPLPAPCS